MLIRLLWWLRLSARLTWMLCVFPLCCALATFIALVDVLEAVRTALIEEWRTV